MFDVLEKISEQVTKYCTVFGQGWYLCTFVFRLAIVGSIGAAVYGDEQGAFACDTASPGCTQICYNQFAYMSQHRFWCFQLIGVILPAVMFHFYSLHVTSEVEKFNMKKKELEEMDEFDDTQRSAIVDMEALEGLKRRKAIEKAEKKIGKVRTKQIYSKAKGGIVDVVTTKNIQVAYYITAIAKAVAEGVFIYLAFYMFHYGRDPVCEKPGVSLTHPHCNDTDVLPFIWMSVPTAYKCSGGAAAVTCQSLITGDPESSVSCWVSRAHEKTVLIRYMQVFSAIAFVLCLCELVYAPIKYMWGKSKKSRQAMAPQFINMAPYPTDDKYVPTSAAGKTNPGFVVVQGLQEDEKTLEKDVWSEKSMSGDDEKKEKH